MRPNLTLEEIAYICSAPAWLPKHDNITYFRVTANRIKIYTYIGKIKYSISYPRPVDLFMHVEWFTTYILGDIYGRGD